MARARNIKPGFYKNEDLAECTVWARFIFPGLWMLADRAGLLEDRPKRIKAEILPFDTMDVEPLLAELAQRKFIVRYSNADGAFIFIPGFSTHQSPHYSEKPSGINPPPLPDKGGYQEPSSPSESPEPSRSPPNNSRSDAPIKRGSQPPDSLNPDSLNPDSTHREIKRPASATARAEQAVAALRVLVEADKRITLPAKGRMHLGQWATEGVTPEQLTQAIRIARTRKPHPELIPFAYLVPIVGDVKAGKAIDPDEARGKDAIPEALERIRAREARDAAKAPEPPSQPQPTRAREAEPEPVVEAHFAEVGETLDNPYADGVPLPDAGEELAIEDEPRWWEHPDRVMARAVELQVQVFDGEGFEDLTARVLAAMGPGPHTAELDPAFQERVQYFAAVGVNSDAARPQAN